MRLGDRLHVLIVQPFEAVNFNCMSFQSCLTNIKAKTGSSPDDFMRLSDKKGFSIDGKLGDKVKASEIVAWLKDDFDLDHGHSMAVYALLTGKKDENSK